MELQNSLHNMLVWFLNPGSGCLNKEGDYTVNLIAENICSGYKNLVLNSKISSIKKITAEELDETEYLRKDRAYLAPVAGLKQFVREELNDYLVDFLIHGSIASLDYAKGWSDFDTYLIIKNDILMDRDSLVNLRKKLLFAHNFLLRIDPRQHHGFLLCSEKDLINYPSYYMPAEALKYAKSLFSSEEIILKEIEVGEKKKEHFTDLVSLFKQTYQAGVFPRRPYQSEYLSARFKNGDNGFFQFKNYIGYLAIAPAYFLEAKGTPAYKKDAFSLVKKEVPADFWKIIDKVTAIRAEWPLREKFPYPGNKIPIWARELIGEDYFKEGYELIRALSSRLEHN